MTRERLYEQLWEHRVSMLRLAWSILRHDQNAEDAVSTAILQACSKADALRDENALKPWLMRITANCCYDLLRRAKRERIHLESMENSGLFISGYEGSLLEVVSCLPAETAQVLTLFYYENFSTAEIAHVLGWTGAAVRVRLLRGRRQLRRLIEEEGME